LAEKALLEETAHDEYPEPPKCITGIFNCNLYYVTRQRIEALGISEAERNIMITALEKRQAQRKAIDKKHKGDLEDRYFEACDARDAIEARLIKIPAKTVDGIFIKLTIWNTRQIEPLDSSCYCDRIMIDAIEDADRLSKLRKSI
jgi:hypothetical protein